MLKTLRPRHHADTISYSFTARIDLLSTVSDNDQIKPIFLPGGVAGPDKRAGYVSNTSGGIQALDLAQGELIWRSELTASPLIVRENDLAALKRAVPEKENALQVVLLDRNDQGKLLLESDAIIFPDWVSAAIRTTESFGYSARLEGDDLLLEWEAQARYRGGAPPPAYIQAQAKRAATGIARIDLKTGKVRMLPAESRREIELPGALQESTMFSYQIGTSDTWETEPWGVDEKMAAAITGEIDEEEQALQLQRWNPATGKAQKAVALVKGLALVSYVTPDGCYLFIHSEMPTASSPGAKTPWWLFSVATGKQLAVLDYEQGTREACVLASKVYYIVDDPPPALRSDGEILRSTIKALDIVSGRLLWQHLLSTERSALRPALRQ